jgi:hypothetical protein
VAEAKNLADIFTKCYPTYKYRERVDQMLGCGSMTLRDYLVFSLVLVLVFN